MVVTGEYVSATTFKLGMSCPEELAPLGECPLRLILGLILKKGGLTLLLLGAAEVDGFRNDWRLLRLDGRNALRAFEDRRILGLRIELADPKLFPVNAAAEGERF